MSRLFTPTRDCLQLLMINPILQTQLTILLVALSIKTQYNTFMDHLYEYVKENMDFTKSEFNNEGMSDEELFDVVMENVISSVEYYGWVNYKKDMEKNEDG